MPITTIKIYTASLAVVICLLTFPRFACANDQIGVAVVVRNDVTGKLAAKQILVNDGEDVYGQEIIKTGVDSSAKLVFKDDTNLAVGPNASVTLDKFVYAGPSDYQKATFNLVKGGFRFTTGNSDKRAYEIKTPTGVLSVRGTIFDTFAMGDRVQVSVVEGKVIACPMNESRDRRSDHPKCMEVLAGQSIVMTRASIVTAGRAGGFNFAGACGATPSLCEQTQMAEISHAGLVQQASLASDSLLGPNQTALAIAAAGAGAGAGAGIAASNNNSSSSNTQESWRNQVLLYIAQSRQAPVSPGGEPIPPSPTESIPSPRPL